jgi:hypothetical protein
MFFGQLDRRVSHGMPLTQVRPDLGLLLRIYAICNAPYEVFLDAMLGLALVILASVLQVAYSSRQLMPVLRFDHRHDSSRSLFRPAMVDRRLGETTKNAFDIA